MMNLLLMKCREVPAVGPRPKAWSDRGGELIS